MLDSSMVIGGAEIVEANNEKGQHHKAGHPTKRDSFFSDPPNHPLSSNPQISTNIPPNGVKSRVIYSTSVK